MLAAYKGHKDCVQFLLDCKAFVNARSSTGWTVLMLAAGDGYLDIVKILVSSGAEIDEKNNKGITAIMQAARYVVIF